MYVLRAMITDVLLYWVFDQCTVTEIVAVYILKVPNAYALQHDYILVNSSFHCRYEYFS